MSPDEFLAAIEEHSEEETTAALAQLAVDLMTTIVMLDDQKLRSVIRADVPKSEAFIALLKNVHRISTASIASETQRDACARVLSGFVSSIRRVRDPHALGRVPSPWRRPPSASARSGEGENGEAYRSRGG